MLEKTIGQKEWCVILKIYKDNMFPKTKMFLKEKYYNYITTDLISVLLK